MDEMMDKQTILCALDEIEAEVTSWRHFFANTKAGWRWIPCSERLPEKNCRCLTTNTAWGAFEVDFNVWINGEWLYPNEKPIAWMPLPEPYKKGEEHE